MPFPEGEPWSFREQWLLSNSKRESCFHQLPQSVWISLCHHGWKAWAHASLCHASPIVVPWRKHKRQNYFPMLYTNLFIWPVQKMPGTEHLLWQLLMNKELRSHVRLISRALVGLQFTNSCANSVYIDSVFMVPLVRAVCGTQILKQCPSTLPIHCMLIPCAFDFEWTVLIWPWVSYLYTFSLQDEFSH